MPCSSVLDLIHSSSWIFIFVGYHVAVSPGMEYCEADFLGVEVTGATLGIIGMGSIGYKIALRAKAFEMKILYHNRTRR